MAFTMPQIPLGTFLPDGVRVGPEYTELINPLDATSSAATNYYNRYGPGTLLSPIATYTINPYSTNTQNVCATQSVGTAGYLTLTGDSGVDANVAAQRITDAVGNTYLQFDWPRCVSVTVSGAAMTGSTNVTVFGTDFYGFPMQYTFTVQATGTYGITLHAARAAFYTVTAVYCNGTTGSGSTGKIALQTTNIFGLPYRLKRKGDLIGFTWDGGPMMDQYGISAAMSGNPGTVVVTTPAVGPGASSTFPAIPFARRTSGGTPGNVAVGAIQAAAQGQVGSFTLTSTSATETSTFSWMIPNGGQNLVLTGNVTDPATGTTGDPRGVFKLPEPSETWAAVPDGSILAKITYYIEGADAWLNQLGVGQKPFGDESTYTPLTVKDLYGIKPYYSGTPA